MVAGGAAWAQQEPLPIRIESDSAELSQQEGTSTYTGSVVLTRGGLTLTGDKLVVTRLNDRGNVKAVLNGAPARLDKQPDRTGDDVVTGHSSRIEYTNADSTVVMRGNAVVNRGGDRIASQVIRHNLDTQRTQAARGENDGERVQITITPQNDGDGS
ncbi:sugar transporter [Salinisphaera orenii MK-B5]|uniref:Lipopolysaccharide export system protein LptA n=2 Tax=Salinisphaera orenii TaxID=856731 RepID=A0A423PHB0_9GAMM|nr:sugar transporter [Salinisphaera orenii MK-B5]ROO37683.1 sugar transporter [Salinisphaera halophila YIM 95161]